MALVLATLLALTTAGSAQATPPAEATASAVRSTPPQRAAPPAAQGEVVVTARTKRVTTMLKTVLHTSGIDQFGRYEVPVCPGISGAPRGTEQTLLRLVRENGAKSGVRLAPLGCKPNALALFVTTPDVLVAGLKKKSPGWFGLISMPDFQRLSTGGAPIRSWHVIETSGRDGEYLDDFDGIEGSGGRVETPSSGYAKVVRNAAATRVYENTRQDILLGFAVIDSNATVGKTLQQLADIISLHLYLDLGQDASRSAGPSSILSLFQPHANGAGLPGEMSRFDRGLLTGTYQLERNNYNSSFQRHRIARSIARGEAAPAETAQAAAPKN